MGGGTSGDLHRRILSSALGKATRHGAARFSAGKIASGEPRSPIAVGGAFPRGRGPLVAAWLPLSAVVGRR